MGNSYGRRRREQKELEAEEGMEGEEQEYAPRVAWLFHSWMGWLEFVWQLLMLIVSVVFFFNVGEHRIIPYISLVVVTIVVNLVLLLVLWFYWGPTYGSRQSMSVTTQPVLDPQTQKPTGCAYISVCDKPAAYCRKIRRDLEFHNDQWHFLKVVLLYSCLLIALAILVGRDGVGEFRFPTVYDRHETNMAVIMKIIYAFGCAIAAGVITTIGLESHSCFIKTTLCNLNVELRNRGVLTADLTSTDEQHALQLKQSRQQAGGVTTNYGFHK